VERQGLGSRSMEGWEDDLWPIYSPVLIAG